MWRRLKRVLYRSWFCLRDSRLLPGRTKHCAVGAEDTAIAGQGLQPCVTAGTLVEVEAGIRGHLSLARLAALRAGDNVAGHIGPLLPKEPMFLRYNGHAHPHLEGGTTAGRRVNHSGLQPPV